MPVADYGRGVFTALLFLTSYYYAEVVNGDEADVLVVSALSLWLAFILRSVLSRRAAERHELKLQRAASSVLLPQRHRPVPLERR